MLRTSMEGVHFALGEKSSIYSLYDNAHPEECHTRRAFSDPDLHGM